jgi:phospholipid transport system substrate-binding protein
MARIKTSVPSRWIQNAVLAGLTSTFLFGNAIAVAATDPAALFVRKAAVEAIAILSNRSLQDNERRTQFRGAILRNFDAAAIARLVVEPYWARASADQQSRFQAVFAGALANIYTERFYDYDGQSLQIKSTRADASGTTIVRSTISTPTGSTVYDIDWIVTGPSGQERFLDVVIDGVSTSATTKQDYASFLRGANGNLDALSTALKAKGN